MADKLEDTVKPEQLTKEYKEAVDIFPALHKFQAQHSLANLQKLCVEVSEFCRAIYASTQNEDERKVYEKKSIIFQCMTLFMHFFYKKA